jgi:DNA-directed RNA polymerase subunit RPC12/RpoP
MQESRLTLSKEMMEQLWQGYRCASCLEDVTRLGAFPKACPLCGFRIAAFQRRRLEQDFVEQVEQMQREGWMEREQGFLEEKFHQPKPQIHVRRKP